MRSRELRTGSPYHQPRHVLLERFPFKHVVHVDTKVEDAVFLRESSPLVQYQSYDVTT